MVWSHLLWLNCRSRNESSGEPSDTTCLNMLRKRFNRVCLFIRYTYKLDHWPTEWTLYRHTSTVVGARRCRVVARAVAWVYRTRRNPWLISLSATFLPVPHLPRNTPTGNPTGRSLSASRKLNHHSQNYDTCSHLQQSSNRNSFTHV